jgi:hypothetical protein
MWQPVANGSDDGAWHRVILSGSGSNSVIQAMSANVRITPDSGSEGAVVLSNGGEEIAREKPGYR